MSALFYLLVQFHISEDRVYPPSLGEHGAECEGEPGHEQPGSRRADVGERLLTGEPGVHPEEDDATVRQHAAYDDEVVKVGRGHLDVPVRQWKV